MLIGYKKKHIDSFIIKKLKQYGILQNVKFDREIGLLIFFVFLFVVILVRLFFLQIINASYYETLLSRQHISRSLLKANRGHIYAYDNSGNPIQFTENIMMYDVFVEPQFIRDKERFIDILTPVIYEHLCVENGLNYVDLLGCIRNLETFANKDLLPKEPEFFYFGSGIISEGIDAFDKTGYNNQIQQVLDSFSTGAAYQIIKTRLDKKIYIGVLPRNYMGFFANKRFIDELNPVDYPYVEISYGNYLYINPNKVRNLREDVKNFKLLLGKYGYLNTLYNIDAKFSPLENQYVKITTDVSPNIVNKMKDLKRDYYKERNRNRIPILHGLGFEEKVRRYYPYGDFSSHVLGYVDKNSRSYYGIEQYYDDFLAGKDGKIIGRSSAWIGQVGANEFQIENVEHGGDIFLTIDVGIQREIEMIANAWHKSLRADSVSILVYDPNEGHIKGSTNMPGFNPNGYNDSYQKMSLGLDHRYLIDDETYVDIPVYIHTGGVYRVATTYERSDIEIKKYINKNIYGPRVFIDRNISMAYEPGSIFKGFTVAIGIDIDEIRFYDFYDDPGFVEVGPYTIKNADKVCQGYHSFMHAFVYSCNVGMVRIAQKIEKYIFYNYLKKLGFGEYTGIELAGEDDGKVTDINSISKAGFFNNTYGQGIQVTPLQIAVGYGALVNGGYYIKPTIIAGVRDPKTGEYVKNKKNIVRQIFKEETSKELKDSLFEIMETNISYIKHIRVPGFTTGGKSGTSQIAYRGKYRSGIGWTNGSFVGIVTRDNTKYVVVIQVRRPRSSLWGGETAGRIFKDVGQFLGNYAFLES